MRKPVIILVILFLLACQTTEERTGTPYSDVTINTIDKALEKGELLDALWLCELYSRQDIVENLNELQAKRNQIIQQIQDAIDRQETNDPESLMKMYDSLVNLGLDVPDIGYDTLINKYRDSLALQSERAAEWYPLSTRDMSGAAEPDNENNNVVWDDIIKSTVTVYLDRGIKIEGGYGYKDLMLGSGFFITDDGYIITNYHVIESHVDPTYEGFSRVYIKLEDSSSPRIPVKVVGWDPIFDLALLKAEIDAPMTIPLVQTAELKAGDRIYAIGSPGGLEKTLTSGIVSAPERPLLELGNILQVDVPINHGNSGGPLLNESGQLVGVVFAGVENFEGINFAIPGKYLFYSLFKMAEGGIVKYPFLGFIVTNHKQGAEVIYVFPNSSAGRCGIQVGDVITSVNGKMIEKTGTLLGMLHSFKIGELTDIHVLRDEKELEFVLKNDKRLEKPLMYALDNDLIENVLYPVFGMKLQLVEKNLFFKKFSVQRVLSGSAAEEQGLSVDDTLKFQNYKYLEDKNALILDVNIRKKSSGFLDIKMQIGAYLYANGIF
ncbi:MAG: trypsin-like peptidase domain-containing protein [Spirochaetales bacterium]|nr:trypsin-like peptidase domain-containing protein [Spirochaetales bacterium]